MQCSPALQLCNKCCLCDYYPIICVPIHAFSSKGNCLSFPFSGKQNKVLILNNIHVCLSAHACMFCMCEFTVEGSRALREFIAAVSVLSMRVRRR